MAWDVFWDVEEYLMTYLFDLFAPHSRTLHDFKRAVFKTFQNHGCLMMNLIESRIIQPNIPVIILHHAEIYAFLNQPW